MELKAYQWTLMALAGMGLLSLIQQFVAATIKNVVQKDKGHVPGKQILSDHDDLGFRAERAFYNTQENLLAFTIVAVLAIVVKVNPSWAGILALTFLGARFLHMVVYYANIPPVRTLMFLIGFLCNVGLGVLALLKVFAL